VTVNCYKPTLCPSQSPAWGIRNTRHTLTITIINLDISIETPFNKVNKQETCLKTSPQTSSQSPHRAFTIIPTDTTPLISLSHTPSTQPHLNFLAVRCQTAKENQKMQKDPRRTVVSVKVHALIFNIQVL